MLPAGNCDVFMNRKPERLFYVLYVAQFGFQSML
jgi:hypothetical protein